MARIIEFRTPGDFWFGMVEPDFAECEANKADSESGVPRRDRAVPCSRLGLGNAQRCNQSAVHLQGSQ